MKKKLLPVLLCALTLAASAQATDNRAQTQDATTATKLDRSLRAVQKHYKNYAQTRRATRGAQDGLTAADSLAAPKVNYNGTRQSILAPLSLIITTQPDRSEEVAAMLVQAGQHAQRISPTTVTARVTAAWIDQLAADARVVRLTASKRMRPFLNRARAATGVDRVHNGEELKTPFTGKGVLVGVIDQSFQYKHMGFVDKDGKSRVKAIWDRSLDPTTNEPKNSTPILNVDATSETHEEFDTGSSHATHVTNIAAGTKHTQNPYYGVAHEADLIMIPSTFDQAEVVEDVEYIKKYAEAAKQPWVVNMSFGGVIGPHDGSTEYDQQVDALVRGKGGIAVAAMGNEGDMLLHASSTFQPGQSKQLFVQYDKGEDAEEDDLTYIDLWGAASVTAEQFTITPILALTRNASGQGTVPQITKRNATFWKKYLDEGEVLSEIDSRNGRENHYLGVKLNKLLTDLGKTYDDVVFGLEITAKSTNTAPATLHGWIEAIDPNYAEFLKLSTNSKLESIRPDNLYIVGEGAASIPSAIAVGSYTTYVPHKGADAEVLGARSSFSSNGPWLNANYTKPAVLAPGSQIMSALNQYAPDFDSSSASSTTTWDNRRYYYGLMQGTSMSSPFVAGAIALWLQANPQLTSADVMNILKTTSTKHAQMGGQAWTSTYGYGIINVYEGLKLALNMPGSITALSRVSSSTTPATFHLLPSQWQVLFNNPERTATLSVVSLDGRTLFSQTLANVAQGQEVNIATDRFTPGVYVLQVTTPGAKLTQKVVRR